LSFEILGGNVGKKTPILIGRKGEELSFKNEKTLKPKKEVKEIKTEVEA